MACCGRTCSISLDGGPVSEAYIADISVSGESIDVSKFGDGAAGTTIVCKETATVTVNSYVDPGVSVGDDIAFSCSVCDVPYSAASVIVSDKNCHFEATGVPYYVTTVKVNGSIVGF